MPTTIDTLQIEIQSGSDSAVKGIRELAGALQELKSSGTVTTVIKNLNSLSASLKGFSDASKAASALSTLANSIERLRGAGSIASIGNNLAKLPASLKALENINIDGVAPKLQGIANAVAPLSAVKAGGLNTMMNALSKLGSVTASLDDDKIAAFAEKIKILNAHLEPLSAKMTTIKAGFNAISTNARRATSSVKEFGDGVNTSTLNMSSFITVAQTVMEVLAGVVQKFSEFIGEAIEWDGIAARFGRGFGDQAAETYAWIQRLNEEMGINVQQFMQYSSIYATMLTGFGVANEDATKMALGYTELTYDIWAGYNDIYASFDEASEAVKSAIAGEVEPIRRAGFTIIESTLEQTAANHGLEISLANATEAQKSYLRYLTLVDQAHAQNLVGTYAKELNTAEGLMRTFAQQLKSLVQAFGSLFLPILVRVMPYLQAFVEILTDGVRAIAAFFGITIQGVDWSGYNAGSVEAGENTENLTDSLGNATAAAKELKNATLGIDELNVISPPSASGGSGGSGGAGGGGDGFSDLDIDSLWDESIFDNIQSQVDEIKAKFEDWAPVIAGIGTALAGLGLTKLLNHIDTAQIGLGKLGKGVTLAGISIAVGALVWDFTGAYLEGGDEADLLKALGSTALGAALAYWLAGKAGAGIVLAVSGVVTLTRLVVELAEGSVEWDDPEALTTALVGGLETAVGGVLTWKALKPAITKGLQTLWPHITKAFAGVVTAASSTAVMASAIVAGVVGFITFAVVDYDFTDFGEKVGKALGSGIRKSAEFAKEVGTAILDGIKAGIKWLEEEFEVDSFGELVAKMLNPVTWGELIMEHGGNLLENLNGNIEELFDGFWDGMKEGLGVERIPILENLFDFDDIGDVFSAALTLTNPTKLISDAFHAVGKEVFPGFYSGIEENWEEFKGDVKDKFNDVVDSVKDFLGIHSPSTLFADIGKDCVAGLLSAFTPSAIKDKLVAMWNTAKSWWESGRPSLKEYTPSIGSIYEKLKERWDNARTWWNDKKTKAKEYTPSIGSIYEKLKDRWDNARNWWNSKKTKAKEYTPSIGSIYDKLKSRWDNARSWWNSKKAAMKTYTPSIGSITDKLKSAWNSAKSWWNKNVKLSTKLNIQVPTIKVKWDTATAFGKSFKYPTGFDLKFAAAGGIFDAGSLIWAGERGAEVVANAGGGKTGVMNVQQMQDAVYEGVFAAVSAAMRGTGGGEQNINVFLDGRQITATVERRQRERGATIMGNEVYSY